MFGWFKTTSPLKPNQRHWINQRFDWLRTEFGDDRLRGPVVTPSDEFFPNSYAGTFDDASALFERVCKYMDVDRNRIDLADGDLTTAHRAFAVEAELFHQEGVARWLSRALVNQAHVEFLAGRCSNGERPKPAP